MSQNSITVPPKYFDRSAMIEVDGFLFALSVGTLTSVQRARCTLMVQGAFSFCDDQKQSEGAKKCFVGGYQRLALERVGHFQHLEASPAVAAAINRLLQKLAKGCLRQLRQSSHEFRDVSRNGQHRNNGAVSEKYPVDTTRRVQTKSGLPIPQIHRQSSQLPLGAAGAEGLYVSARGLMAR
jgi:hypothetical protein